MATIFSKNRRHNKNNTLNYRPLALIKKIIILSEYFLVSALVVAVFTISPEPASAAMPQLPMILTTIVMAAALLATIGFLRKPTSPLSYTWVSGITLITLFNLFLRTDSVVPVAPAALLITIVAGLAGRHYSWIIPFLLFSFGGALRTLAAALLSRQSLSPETLLGSIPLDPFSYLYLLLAGMLPALMSASYRIERYVPTNALIPEQTGSLSTEQAQKTDTAKTQNFTVESLSEFSRNFDAHDVSELLSSVVYFMSRNFRSFSSLGFIYDPQHQEFVLNSFQSKSISIIKNVRIPLGNGVVGRIGTEKRSFMTGDLRVYNSDLLYYSSEEQINSILAVPIISEQRELLGTLVLDCKERQAFKDLDKDTLKRFSGLAAALITTSRMRSFQERSARTFQTFYEASHQFTTALKPEQVFEVLFSVIPTVVNGSRQIGIIFDEERNLGRVTNVGGNRADIVPGFTFSINAGLYSFAFQKRRSVSIGDYRQFVGRYYRFAPNEPDDPSIRSLMIFPILDDEQRCRGLYSIESDTPNLFTSYTEQILTTLVENGSVAFIRAVLYQRMERLATTDGLTGLNNHRNFQEQLAQEMERSRRYQRPLALLLMDIDHFKSFNDTYGHPVGDLVLKEIAACIQKSVRCNDIPARYGGEEFVVIIPETDEKGARITAERIRSTIEQHTIISLGRELKVTVSIGCSAFPENAPSQQVLIDTADKALYAAKERGRNRVILYRNGM